MTKQALKECALLWDINCFNATFIPCATSQISEVPVFGESSSNVIVGLYITILKSMIIVTLNVFKRGILITFFKLNFPLYAMIQTKSIFEINECLPVVSGIF